MSTLEWRRPSKKQRYVLLDSIYATKKDYLSMGVLGVAIARKQPNGTVLWEGGLWARKLTNWSPKYLQTTYVKRMFRNKAEAMAMVAISVRLENYDGFE